MKPTMLGNHRQGSRSISLETHKKRASMAVLIGLLAMLAAIFLLHRGAKQQESEAQRQAATSQAEALGTLTRLGPRGQAPGSQQREASSGPGEIVEYVPEAEPVIQEVRPGQAAVRQ
jgi:hypothetical protein